MDEEYTLNRHAGIVKKTVKRLLANPMILEENLASINNRETQFDKTCASVYLNLSEVWSQTNDN